MATTPAKKSARKAATPRRAAVKAAPALIDTLFIYDSPVPKEVALAGAFNDWQPLPMKAEKLRGRPLHRHSVSLMLPAGEHEYKFIVDGQWICDPKGDATKTNDLGSMNSVILVA